MVLCRHTLPVEEEHHHTVSYHPEGEALTQQNHPLLLIHCHPLWSSMLAMSCLYRRRDDSMNARQRKMRTDMIDHPSNQLRRSIIKLPPQLFKRWYKTHHVHARPLLMLHHHPATGFTVTSVFHDERQDQHHDERDNQKSG